jgi:cell division protein FtsW
MLLSIGLSTLYSASAYLALTDGLSDVAYLARQVQGAALGMALLFVVSQLDYHRWDRWSWLVLGGVTMMLVVVLLPGTEAIAPRLNGARRWISVGPLTLQPSEFAKIALLIWTARTLARKQERLTSLRRGLLPFLIAWGVVLILIALEPSMSAAALCAVLVALLAFVGRARIGHFVLLATLAGVPLWFFVTAAEYRVKRIMAFLDPLAHQDGASYQIVQAMTAIGSGGLFGTGFGQSRMKAGFVPEPHNDFASAILGEEWGLIGLVVLCGLYVAVAALGVRIARRAPDLFGTLLAIGMTLLLVIPALLHLAINLSLVPPTGVALPFISYGRSNLLVNFWAAGILLNIAAAGCRVREIREHLTASADAGAL